MNIAGINFESVNDGEGVRTVVYVSGCSHRCPNCHNPKTHDTDYGMPFTPELQEEIVENIKKRPFISGLTLSGGDPLYDKNLSDVLNLVNKIRIQFGNTKTIWLYTGYTYEECMQNPIRKEIVSNCDILVDGRYVDDLRDISLPYRGSSNQRIIDISKSTKEKVVLYET